MSFGAKVTGACVVGIRNIGLENSWLDDDLKFALIDLNNDAWYIIRMKQYIVHSNTQTWKCICKWSLPKVHSKTIRGLE